MVVIMIINLIAFLYDIKVEIVRKKGESYIFMFKNDFYIFQKCFINNDYLTYIYNFIENSNVPFHKIIKNRHNKYVSTYNNENYILMVIKFNTNRLLVIEDILNSCRYHVSYVRKGNFNWPKLWKNKIDQVEYFITSSKLKIDIYTMAIINYYLGLAELAISLIDSIQVDYFPLSICHIRIPQNCDLYDYYSVTNLVFDHMGRDVGEYLKNYIYNDNKINLESLKAVNGLDINDRYLVLSRVLFPSYFFDLFDDYVVNNKDFKYFYQHFVNWELYQNNLKEFIKFVTKKEF